jgi:hypothetical protein
MREKVSAGGVNKGIKPGKSGNFFFCHYDSNFVNIQAFGDVKCDSKVLDKHNSRSVWQ